MRMSASLSTAASSRFVGSFSTHRLSIQKVFLLQDPADTRSVLEGQESESPRATRLGIAHDGRMSDLAKLREVGLERFW